MRGCVDLVFKNSSQNGERQTSTGVAVRTRKHLQRYITPPLEAPKSYNRISAATFHKTTQHLLSIFNHVLQVHPRRIRPRSACGSDLPCTNRVRDPRCPRIAWQWWPPSASAPWAPPLRLRQRSRPADREALQGHSVARRPAPECDLVRGPPMFVSSQPIVDHGRMRSYL